MSDDLKEKAEPLRDLDHDADEDRERELQKRAHFPHLSKGIEVRESDEYPTFFEQ